MAGSFQASRSCSARFSQVLAGQLMRPHVATAPESVLLLVASSSSVSPKSQTCFSPVPATSPPTRRASVWTRLGWRRVGFWTFRNKYGWRARCRAALAKPRGSGRLAGHRCQKVARGALESSVCSRGQSIKVPTKRELDAQLDGYMAMSKKRLDADLDAYMAKSKKQLDADLDAYMALAGQSPTWWE
ncbi:uncharacterized protein LOC119135900 isoform X2 [Syngnathus acus]|uniref:uncharacterized protein LOC119135900 isoform X2 n=1 Tax=Syngnathus acus TaxID=161584 RepID=UPI001885F4F2|nr:uncharacterized protein LOC119135900 isoform X2 [Syngnathus acus]XP_037129792.1 uncharacterized protein LOC119135900 isoform X2 [Syngnathus acus]